MRENRLIQSRLLCRTMVRQSADMAHGHKPITHPVAGAENAPSLTDLGLSSNGLLHDAGGFPGLDEAVDGGLRVFAQQQPL